MNLEEFYILFEQYGDRDIVPPVPCDNYDKCGNILPSMNKDSMRRNIKRNDGKLFCRSCSYTEEGKTRISEATSYKRSPETRQKMSESANKKWASAEGKILKSKLSKLTAQKNSTNFFEKSKRKGLYPSIKTNKLMAYNSSYELYFCWLLDYNNNVLTYETQIYYEIEDRGRSLDFLIEYKNQEKLHVIEIKPFKRLNEDRHKKQLQDSKLNAESNNWDFDVYTEIELGRSCKWMRDWADEFRSQLYNIDYVEHRKEKYREKANRHYNKVIKNDKITYFCEYCQEEHTQLVKTYNENVEKNGRHICHQENAEKPKPSKNKKTNIYADQGMKECNKCSRILPFECFHLDKSKPDGYYTICKECRKGIEPK